MCGEEKVCVRERRCINRDRERDRYKEREGEEIKDRVQLIRLPKWLAVWASPNSHFFLCSIIFPSLSNNHVSKP
jgi:hypothetical protein